MRYGSFAWNAQPRGATGPPERMDVWAFTVTGLDVPRPGVEIAQNDGRFVVEAGPNTHTETILVDDKAGTYLESIDY